MEIRRTAVVADAAAAERLFDVPVRTEWAERFPTAAGHHLLLACAEDAEGLVGFVSGVGTAHPGRLLRHAGPGRRRKTTSPLPPTAVRGGKDDGMCSVPTWDFA